MNWKKLIEILHSNNLTNSIYFFTVFTVLFLLNLCIFFCHNKCPCNQRLKCVINFSISIQKATVIWPMTCAEICNQHVCLSNLISGLLVFHYYTIISLRLRRVPTDNESQQVAYWQGGGTGREEEIWILGNYLESGIQKGVSVPTSWGNIAILLIRQTSKKQCAHYGPL